MSRWREIHRPDGNNKGLKRFLKELKRQEAEFRNSNTPLERTKAYRLGRVPRRKPRVRT